MIAPAPANEGWQTHPRTDRSTVQGDVRIRTDVYSPELDNRRTVRIYLPPGYAASARRYPVIYLQDGQNLFDAATSYSGEWQVDKTMDALGQEGIEAIVVGVDHAEAARVREYTPFAPAGSGAAYLNFLAATVKPQIDRDFRTQPEPEQTVIGGSSMGGLISLYAFFERPEIFGHVAAMSPSLWVGRYAIYAYVRQASFRTGRIYLDNGRREGSARPMFDLLVEKGYRPQHDLSYCYDPFGRHDEASWARRFPAAVRFLLGEEPREATAGATPANAG